MPETLTSSRFSPRNDLVPPRPARTTRKISTSSRSTAQVPGQNRTTATSSHLVPTSSLVRGRPQIDLVPTSPSLTGGRGRRDVEDIPPTTTSRDDLRDDLKAGTR